jgi:hypothetical protein
MPLFTILELDSFFALLQRALVVSAAVAGSFAFALAALRGWLTLRGHAREWGVPVITDPGPVERPGTTVRGRLSEGAGSS